MSSRRIAVLTLVGAIVVALVAPVAAAQRAALARRVAGCYGLALGPDWHDILHPFGRGGAHEYNAPPRAVELRLAAGRGAGPGGPFELIPARGASPTRHRMNGW